MAKYKKRKDGRYAAWVTTDEINPETGKRRDRKCERAERDSGRDGNATKTGDLCVL